MPKYNSPTTAMKHQLEAIAKSEAKPPVPSPEDVFAYLMEMGTGKSKVACDEYGSGVVNGGPIDLLVLGPAGSYRNWYEDKSDLQRAEINVHLDPALRERMIVAPWVTGGGKAAKDRIAYMLRTKDPKRPRALFMNTEALSTVEEARDLCMEFLGQRLAYMVVDESTMIKNHKSRRSKYVNKIGAEAASRRILTGSVAPRSPMDLYAQFSFLDWRILGHRSYYSFRARYAILRKMDMGGRKFDVEVGYRNVEELAELIEPYSYRALKEDCLDLEPKVYTVREVELTPEQRRMQKELKEFATAKLGDGQFVSTNLVIQQIMRMHQINLGHVRDEHGNIHEIPENRTAELMEVLEEHNGKAIIWAPYDFNIRKIVETIKKAYGEKSVAAFWGGNKKERSEEERRFLGDPECRFMVSTPAAGGRGNTWVVADLVVYYGNTEDLELRQQSEDRAHRKGQNNKVTYVDLIARGTVDEKMVKSLRKKIDMSSLINRENYREWVI